jgi:hypothetical protein
MKAVRYFIVKIVRFIIAVFSGLTLSEAYAEHADGNGAGSRTAGKALPAAAQCARRPKNLQEFILRIQGGTYG